MRADALVTEYKKAALNKFAFGDNYLFRATFFIADERTGERNTSSPKQSFTDQ